MTITLNALAACRFRPTRGAKNRGISVVVSVIVKIHVLMTVLTRKTSRFVYPQPASTPEILGNTLDMVFFHIDRIYDWLADQSLALNGSCQSSRFRRRSSLKT